MRLIALDEIWTEAALMGFNNRLVETSQLIEIGQEMFTLVPEVAAAGPHLQDLYRSNQQDVDTQMAELLWGDDEVLSRRDTEDLRWFISNHGGLPSLVDSVASLPGQVQLELGLLRRQLANLQGEGNFSGDLSRSFRCGLAQQLIVGGGLAIPGAVVAGLAVPAATLAMALTGGVAGIAFLGFGLVYARRIKC